MNKPMFKTTESLILCVVCVVLCKFIALIFGVIAYSKYESAENAWYLEDYSSSKSQVEESRKYLKIGISLAVIFSVIDIIVVFAILSGLGVLIGLGL